MPSVYLIHFSEPFKHARHYIGFTKFDDVENRFNDHAKGAGARLTQIVVGQGINLTLARVWPDQSRTFERSLKNKKNSARLCPICKAKQSA